MRYLILFVLLLSPVISVACSCAPSSDEDAYERSKVVFLVKVTEAKLVNGSPFDLVRAKFDVIEKFKGEAINVETLESTATSTCATALLPGHQYLVYSNNDPIKHINACTRSRWVNAVREKELLERYRNEQ